MTDWKTYRAEDFCLMVTDGTHDSPKPQAEGLYLITSKHLKPSGIDFSSANRISETDYNKIIQRSKVEQYDILFSMIGTIGNIHRVTTHIVDFAVKNMGIFKMGGDADKSLWMYYWLQSPIAQEYIQSRITGSTQGYLTLGNLRDFPVCVPPLEEQRRIVGILGVIDDKIENNRRINTNLELQAQALYKQWFVDFEFPNEEGKPYKSSGGKMVDSELGLIPEGWSVGDIYKYVNVVYGAPYKSALFNERKDGNPLIRIRDLKTFSPQYYTQEILPNTEFINAGDVVAGMDAEFVPCLWMGEKGVLNQRCCKFVGKQDSISNYYVMFLVKPELEFVQSYKTGTTVSHLGKSDIDKFVVVQPPLTVIEKFSKIANALLNNKANLAKENITLVTLRDTLLPKLMNGEIKL